MSNDAAARLALKNHPEKMVHIYRRSIKNGLRTLENTSDVKERKRIRRSIELQRQRLRIWEKRASRK